MLDSLTARTLLTQAMPVVCSDGGKLGVVDRLEGGDTIKLATNGDGKPHYIPLSWVTSVDDSVHLDRPGDQAIAEWSSGPASDGEIVEPARTVNSVDATAGQPMVARVTARMRELETALAALPAEDVRARGDLELALGAIGELMTGDLEKIPPVVVASMSRWLENNKHLAESAVPVADAAAADDAMIDAVTGPMIAQPHPASASL